MISEEQKTSNEFAVEGDTLSSPPPSQPESSLARATELVGKMTLEEKLSMVITYFPVYSPKAKSLGMVRSAGHNPGIPRLGIPPLKETDASLGVSNGLNMRPGDTATALPAGLATAATFDSSLAREGGAMIGAEARAKGFNVLLAGGLNLVRDPWAGRNFEYLGEDPLLAGVLAGSAVQGVQSNKIASTVKHFPLNPQETGRMVMDARIDDAALRESDLLAFQIAIERGEPASVMCAYNKVNGHYSSEEALINKVLKGEWSFKGWVMSDWGGVHSTEKAALAGLDQESGIELDLALNGAIFFTDRLAKAVREGRVPEARLNDMVRRILIGMIETGLMEPAAALAPVDLGAHAQVAQRVAEAGSVLLRNENNTLPLPTSIKRVVVIGGHADVGVLSGGGSSQVRSVGGAPVEVPLTSGDAAMFSRMTWHASSPLNAIQSLLPEAQVSYVDGIDATLAAKAAKAADVAIVFATQWQTEGVDVSTLSLPDDQDGLIDAVAAANPKTIVILETGGPVLMPWLERVPAVLAAWYPGQRGGEAIANVLFGKVNPSGRLPVTFPASADQAPRPMPVGLNPNKKPARKSSATQPNPLRLAISRGITRSILWLIMKNPGLSKFILPRPAPFAVDYQEGANIGYRWYELKKHRPLFPFGHGLSYTAFSYTNLQVQGGSAPTASLDVTNTGNRAGADVPQVYVQASDSQGLVTWRLAGFSRVQLAPGASRRVTVSLEPRTYSRWDDALPGWSIKESVLPIAIGRSATEFVMKGMLNILK